MSDGIDRIWAPWRLDYIKSSVGDKPGCFLCEALQAHQDEERLLLCRETDSFVIMNLYPYINGHLLVAPNRHVDDLDDLCLDEITSLFDLVRRAKGWLSDAYSPHGFNIGINIGRVAGAGLPGHVHVHIVPRWEGDTNFLPVLSSVKVISEGLRSSWEQLKRAVDKDKPSHENQ